MSIKSRRLISFPDKHVAAISYRVTLLNAEAFIVISSEMAIKQSSGRVDSDDPRLAKSFSGRVLHPRSSYSKDRRIVLCHATEKSNLILTCASETTLETTCPHTYKLSVPRISAGSLSQSRPGPAFRSSSQNTSSITPRGRLRLKNSAAALSGRWIG